MSTASPVSTSASRPTAVSTRDVGGGESASSSRDPGKAWLDTAEIKRRSITGAKWLIVMNGLGMPAAFLVSLLLGRIGPTALGVYALAQILIGVITTFVVYGGPPVLPVFMAKIPAAADRGRFLVSYLLVLFGAMTATLALFWLFPRAFEFLLQRPFDMHQYGWFVLLAVVIVVAETLTNAASSLMLIKSAAIARQAMRLVLLPLVVVLFFFRPEILVDYGMPCILGAFLAGYVAAGAISATAISREHRFAVKVGWFLPRGFWAFSLSTMAATVLTFLYGNVDRMAVLSIRDLEGLGKYQAVLSMNLLLEHLPSLLLPSILPAFSHLLGANHHRTFHEAFAVLCRWVVLPITMVSLVLMGFSREILGIFGDRYLDSAHLLTLFGLVAIIRSMGLPSLVIVTCQEKNSFRFLQQLLLVVAQAGLTFLLIAPFGVMGIAGAKMIAVAGSSLIGVLYVVYRLGMAPRLPLSYRVAVLVGIAMTVLRLWACPDSCLAKAVLTSVCMAAFMLLSRFRWMELRGIFRFILHHDVGALTTMAEKN